jgi:hypothetical protein
MNEKPTNALIVECICTQYFPACFGTLKYHHQGVKRDPAETGKRQRDGQDIPTITPPVTIYSSHPSLLPTTLGTYLSRIMFGSLIMTF